LTGITITKVHRNWLPSVSYSVVKDRAPPQRR
jgi:hypothetical protein